MRRRRRTTATSSTGATRTSSRRTSTCTDRWSSRATTSGGWTGAATARSPRCRASPRTRGSTSSTRRHRQDVGRGFAFSRAYGSLQAGGYSGPAALPTGPVGGQAHHRALHRRHHLHLGDAAAARSATRRASRPRPGCPRSATTSAPPLGADGRCQWRRTGSSVWPAAARRIPLHHDCRLGPRDPGYDVVQASVERKREEVTKQIPARRAPPAIGRRGDGGGRGRRDRDRIHVRSRARDRPPRRPPRLIAAIKPQEEKWGPIIRKANIHLD